jgi:hypothetical protein
LCAQHYLPSHFQNSIALYGKQEEYEDGHKKSHKTIIGIDQHNSHTDSHHLVTGTVPVSSKIINDNVEEEPDFEFPKESVVTMTNKPTDLARNSKTNSLPQTRGNSTTKSEREFFVTKILPPRVREKLDQKYGKDNLRQCFKSQACLRLVLLPLLRSHFLQESDWKNLVTVSFEAAMLTDLVRDYHDVDFQNLRGYYRPPEDMDDIPDHRVRMASAALVHFDGDMAELVRWMGGTHVGAHREPEKILHYLQGKIEPATHGYLTRIYRRGVPNYCNAEATEENFQAFRRYGNHTSATEDPAKTLKALLKDFQNSYCLLFDKRLVHFTLNCHLTPQGLIGLEDPTKKPRPIFDSTFRPHPWCHAINDWTDKVNEPPITFPSAWCEYLQWIYNLRISYPEEEIYPADDDVSGAFRQLKYHPNMVAMHSSQILDYMAVATGATFGDCTSPSNWDPVAQARRQLAQFLWRQKDLVSRATPYLPQFTLAPKPQADEVRMFTRADPDSKSLTKSPASGYHRRTHTMWTTTCTQMLGSTSHDQFPRASWHSTRFLDILPSTHPPFSIKRSSMVN